MGRHYKRWAPNFRTVKSEWRQSSDGRKIVLHDLSESGGRFEFQKTPDGWKLDDWHRAQ